MAFKVCIRQLEVSLGMACYLNAASLIEFAAEFTTYHLHRVCA